MYQKKVLLNDQKLAKYYDHSSRFRNGTHGPQYFFKNKKLLF